MLEAEDLPNDRCVGRFISLISFLLFHLLVFSSFLTLLFIPFSFFGLIFIIFLFCYRISSFFVRAFFVRIRIFVLVLVLVLVNRLPGVVIIVVALQSVAIQFYLEPPTALALRAVSWAALTVRSWNEFNA